jgi:hypothetical protein
MEIHEQTDLQEQSWISSDPLAKCRCGCGKQAPVARCTDRSKGHIKGQALLYCKGHHFRRPLPDRFWEKVDKRDVDECWPWTGTTVSKGYGSIGHEGKTLSAHRVSWELHFDSPGDLHVLHSCDNPPCCNPAHLFLGTNADNIRDRLLKERMRISDVLTVDVVRQIRSAYDPLSTTHAMLAAQFGVSPASIGLILQKKSWAWVDPDWEPPVIKRGPKRRFGNARADALCNRVMDACANIDEARARI